MDKLREIGVGIVLVVVFYTLFCLVFAGVKVLWAHLRHRPHPEGFWHHFWEAWFELLNPLNWF